MKIEEPRKVLFLQSSDPDEGRLEVYYTNRGEPYRQGIQLSLERPAFDQHATVFLETWEARALRDLLIKQYPQNSPPFPPNGLLTTVADRIAAGIVVDEDPETVEETAQYVRDLASAASLQDAYNGSQEEKNEWKNRALVAEAELRELPTIEMVLLQAEKLLTVTGEEDKTHVLGDLRNMIIHLPSDSK